MSFADALILLYIALLLCLGLFVWTVKAIARGEVRRQLRLYVLVGSIQPRDERGRFKPWMKQP